MLGLGDEAAWDAEKIDKRLKGGMEVCKDEKKIKDQFRRELEAAGENEFHKVVPVHRVVTQQGRLTEKQKNIYPGEVARMLRAVASEVAMVEAKVQTTDTVSCDSELNSNSIQCVRFGRRGPMIRWPWRRSATCAS